MIQLLVFCGVKLLMSGQYNLVSPGGQGRSGSKQPGSSSNGGRGGGGGHRGEVPGSVPGGAGVPGDAYRSPFSPGGQASFVWSERAMPLAHILKDNNLPLVVKISEEANVRTEGENTMDFRQPLLLYREHQVSRLYARNVTSSSAGKKEVGPFVVIPQNYKGLFRPSGQPGSPVTSVSALARLMPVSVLSKTACEGYVCVSPIQSDVIYQKTSLRPGLYVIKDVLEDEITFRVGGQKSKKSKLVRCLRCVNEDGKVSLFPMKATGQFYVAAVDVHSSRYSAVDSASRVYLWSELTSGPDNNNGNVVADLVYGKPPPQECNFTGTLAFKHVTKDNTVIGCSTAEETSPPRLFELSPDKKGPNFLFALNQDCFDSDNPLARCLKFVKQEFARYVAEMKVRRDYEVECVELRESAT
ncbi:uncharacterized protein LOC143295122 isoform X2 [Babylonia areolata]|uniref:uncharacterized protein LOC143295122 isoform X2 n=1 Tax=Babylonia areolata TaxID=304850 RepID=UPI003FD2D7D5